MASKKIETKAIETKEVKTNKKVTCENVIIKGVSSPSTIQCIAEDKGINPQEVFVRVTFEHKGSEFTVSNKLRFLTKSGYKELIEAQAKQTPMKITVDIDSGFFYIEKDVSIDSLFEQKLEREDTRKPLSALL